jgi:hypothetical protein
VSQGFVLVMGNTPRSPRMACMRDVAGTHPGLKLCKWRVGRAEHGIVDGMVTNPDGFIPRSIKQRKDQKEVVHLDHPTKQPSHVHCVLKLSLSLSLSLFLISGDGLQWV